MKPFEDIQVVGLGQACVDYLGRVPSYPREDGKVELLDLRTQCGGPASTALVTLSRLGSQMQGRRRQSGNPHPPASPTVLGNPPWNMIGGDVVTRPENPKHET